MPITFTTPTTGQPTGPGFGISVSSSIVGPFPVGTDWRIFLRPNPEDTAPRWGLDMPWTTSFQEYGILGYGLQGWQPTEMRSDLVQGQDAFLVAQLVQPVGVVVDSGQIAVKADFTTGLAWSDYATAGGTVQGGFTENDRVVLMQANGGILSLLVDVLLEPVAEWLSSYVPRPYQPIPYGALICDESIITRPDLPPLNRWVGVRWKLVQWPSGLGIVDGFPDHSYAAWGQITLTRDNSDGTVQPYDTRYESRVEGQLLWGTNEPTNVQVYVLPGVCAEFWMLQGPPWSTGRGADRPDERQAS